MSSSDIILTISFTTLLILLLIAGVTISFFIAGRQATKQQMELTNAKLSYEKELRKVETEVSEHLMQQFAHELHDNIGHALTCIRLELENKKLDDPTLVTLLAPIETHLEDASQQLRLLSRSFNTEYVTHINLIEAIQLEVERQRHLKKFAIQFEHDHNNPVLDKNQELMVFRIFQEIIQNAIRHSKAKNLVVTLSNAPTFALEVSDDGIGFSVDETLNSPRASGLKNMKKRATMADLHCEIISTPGSGCQYKLKKNVAAVV